LKITNISTSGNFGVRINLERVDAESNFLKIPCRFPALRGKLFKSKKKGWHIREDTRKRGGEECLTILLFSSGNFICAGVRDKEIGSAFDIIRKELRKRGYRTSLEWQIQNINFAGSFPTNIDMPAFRRKRWARIEYDPDSFPGGRYHYPSKKARTLTFFDTGRFIISGLRYQDLGAAFVTAKKIVRAFVYAVPRSVFVAPSGS
jgi:TATA-box binding protein (TBP) (component of TFIID and TFIIIB)